MDTSAYVIIFAFIPTLWKYSAQFHWVPIFFELVFVGQD